jgi:hypothetical protein
MSFYQCSFNAQEKVYSFKLIEKSTTNCHSTDNSSECEGWTGQTNSLLRQSLSKQNYLFKNTRGLGFPNYPILKTAEFSLMEVEGGSQEPLIGVIGTRSFWSCIESPSALCMWLDAYYAQSDATLACLPEFLLSKVSKNMYKDATVVVFGALFE